MHRYKACAIWFNPHTDLPSISTGTTTTTSGSLPKTALMAMIKAVDVELACDDVLEIWLLLTDLFEDDGHLGPAHRVFANSQPLRMTRWRSMASL